MSSEDELRVVLLGKTGVGKSSLGNTLLGSDVFRVKRGMTSGSKRCQWAEIIRDQTVLQVTDTPGVFDTDNSEQYVLHEIGKSVATASPGPHVVVMVIYSNKKFTEEEYAAYLTMKKMFGDDICNYMIIAFTGIDELAPSSSLEKQHEALERELKSPTLPADLKQVLTDVGHRYFGVNNKMSREDRNHQGLHFYWRMKDLVTQNKGRFLTSRMCEEVNQLVEQLVQQRMARNHQDHTSAAADTKKDIVKDNLSPEFQEKVVRIARLVGECVGAFFGGVGKGAMASVPGGKCSLM